LKQYPTEQAGFPAQRPRRLRRDAATRRLVRESAISVDDLIQPVFVIDGEDRSEAVPSMPGVERLTIDRLQHEAAHLAELGVPAMAIFPVSGPCAPSRPARRTSP
jgi:porphobilinogen synthase